MKQVDNKRRVKKINSTQVNGWMNEFAKQPEHLLASNLMYANGINAVALKPQSDSYTSFDFEINLPSQIASNQYMSGRCWLFAAVNLIREGICGSLELDYLDLSQSYLAFWDKFERANFFLECIIDTIDQDVESRYVHYFLTNVIADGGQWDMAKNIIEKYGIVPKTVFPDSMNSANTNDLNFVINWILRAGAKELRDQANKSHTNLLKIKDKILEDVFKVLVSCYGTLPETFDFEYTLKRYSQCKDCFYHPQSNYYNYINPYNIYHIKKVDKALTPLTFYQKYVRTKLTDYVSVINAPTNEKPLYRRFTFKYLNNVIGGEPIMHYNVSINVLKYLAIVSLKSRRPLWFGADVSFYGNRNTGIWDDQAFDYEVVLGTKFDLDSKGEELDYRAATMNHAMLITGVDYDSSALSAFQQKLNNLKGQEALKFIDENFDSIGTKKWKIQNSWGTNIGNNGYFLMTDSWFSHYVFQLVVQKSILNELTQRIEVSSFDEEPINLEPWDPIGTLA